MIDWIRMKVVELFIGSGQLASLVRHGISVLGGYLTALGIAQETVSAWVDPTTQIVIGLIMALFSYITSRVNKAQEK